MQQKQMDKMVARTGKSRDVLTSEKNSEYGMPRFFYMLAVVHRTARHRGSYISSKCPGHPSCGDPLTGQSHYNGYRKLIYLDLILTEIYNYNPALNECNNSPTSSNLVEDLCTRQARIKDSIDVSEAEHHCKGHRKCSDEANQHGQIP